MRSGNDAVDAVNAAASAIASAESRPQPATVAKKRWWRFNTCFGSIRTAKRISHAVLTPERQPPAISLPFVAPPSSPVSFLPSEPPSATQSPACGLSLSMTMFSPTGPYAHETNLVTPPAFSGFNSEPSTAPFTPPPESVLTTVASPAPKVPFAELLTSSLERARNNSGRYLEFDETKSHLLSMSPTYQLNPKCDYYDGQEMSLMEASEKDHGEEKGLTYDWHSITFGSVIDFNFDSVSDDEDSSCWWSNELTPYGYEA